MLNLISMVWWTGIDLHFSSYQDHIKRQVISQGVPKLGPLTSLFKYLDNAEEFKRQIIQLGDKTHTGPEDDWWFKNHESNIRKIPLSMFNLLSIRADDVVVALEGITIRGICQGQKDALESYEFQEAYDYAHSVCFPVKWVDWKPSIFGLEPTAPGQSVYGIRSL